MGRLSVTLEQLKMRHSIIADLFAPAVLPDEDGLRPEGGRWRLPGNKAGLHPGKARHHHGEPRQS